MFESYSSTGKYIGPKNPVELFTSHNQKYDIVANVGEKPLRVFWQLIRCCNLIRVLFTIRQLFRSRFQKTTIQMEVKICLQTTNCFVRKG